MILYTSVYMRIASIFIVRTILLIANLF